MSEAAGIAFREGVRRRLRRSGWFANALGGVVACVAIGFVVPVFSDEVELSDLALRTAPVVAVYFVIVGLCTRWMLDRNLDRGLEWVIGEREPSEAEHRATLSLAIFSAKVAGAAWASGVAALVLVAGVQFGWDVGLVSGFVVLLGGETTCALYYLDSERILRPVTARALAVRLPESNAGPGLGGRLTGAWWLGTGVPLLGMVVVGVVGLVGTNVDVAYVGAAEVFLGLVATATGVLATRFTARAIARPVQQVSAGVQSIESGDLGKRVPVDDGSEIGRLQAGFNQMADGLAERERIRDLFGRQVGEDVARVALDRGTRLGGEERQVGALFVDIIGSTSMALAMPPSEVVRLLNRFFRVVVDVVERDGALVNKFEGDAALCVFGAPVARDDPAGDALRSARRLAERLRRDMPEIDFGIGISAGEAVAGNVGAEQRYEYTVIGDPVNEASRLSDLAKARPERVLASESALHLAAEEEREAWEVTGSGVLRGRNAPTGLAHPRLPS